MSSIRDFGGVGDGIVDEAAAFDLAFATIVKTGDELFIPRGRWRIARSLAPVNLANKAGGFRIFGEGPSSQIRPDRVQYQIFRFGNATESIVLKDLSFIGSQDEQQQDCGAIIYIGYCGPLIIDRCLFAGLRSDSVDFQGLVHAQFNDVVVRNSKFGGCSHTAGAMVFADEFMRVLIENCDFVDYADFDGQAHRKTGVGGVAEGWIWVKRPHAAQQLNAGDQGTVILRTSRFDEGARRSARIDPEDGPRITRLLVEDIDANVSAAAGSAGVVVRKVDRASVLRSSFAWATGAVRDAVDLQDVDVAELHHLYCVNGASRISADAATQYVHVQDSVYGTLASAAVSTKVTTKGVTV